MSSWRFFIDVGGTFTDVVAISAEDVLRTHKLLSTGVGRGHGVIADRGKRIIDPGRVGDPAEFWVGYSLSTLPPDPITKLPNQVVQFDRDTGALVLAAPIDAREVNYELRSHEEAPVVAIRYLMGLRLTDSIGRVEVRLGTTRATNALLERKGARTAFVTTKGFADVLKIGYQDRPELFKLNIRKREELAETAIEIDERLTARGEVLRTPDERLIRSQLETARKHGTQALAVCLLHAHVNGVHEDAVARIAESIGFEQVSVSSRVARLERIVPRGDTTLVDAYLGGTIRGYVASLRKSMPEARIRLMTSNGGLIDADCARGKDTILSGPAGGVLGCAYVSRAAAFERAIGFDMGGTSTDVMRIEPPPHAFEYQHETVKAGVRIMTPMLAVETVAAGGGSICAFDGQKLTVGPHSAGADPGPACYGRGGPLAVTDMNLILGRVSATHFPFPLDRETVERKLLALSGVIEKATGSRLSPVELAAGFIQIANAHMVAAIRKVSIAKGYDPAEYTLTTFGGAGAQHACAIAEALEIPRVLCSPYAGVLSALGIGTAPIKRVREQSVHEPLTTQSLKALIQRAHATVAELTEEIKVESADSAEQVDIRITMDVCYVGQSTLLTVSTGCADAMRSDFEHQHRRLYGYVHSARPVEIRALRVEASTMNQSPSPALTASHKDHGHVEREPATHLMIVDGASRLVPLYTRLRIPHGSMMEGPNIIIEDTSTIVVDPGWRATFLPSGDILLEHSATGSWLSDSGAPESPLRFDNQKSQIENSPSPIRLELFNNQFAAIAEQMGVTLRRTALSTNVKERLDFSCAVFTSSGDLVVNAPHIPVHLGGMSECVKCLMEDVGSFEPGDVYITNDPFRGGSHLNDITVITPVFLADESGAAVPSFFVASRAHHAEIGGMRPGSMPPDSTNLSQEGVLIRAFRWTKDGQARIEELRTLLTARPYPSRTPDDNIADVSAQVAANQAGAQALLAMVNQHGIEVVRAYMGHIQKAAAIKMGAALRKLSDGVYRFEDKMDDGTAIRLAVTIDRGTATFDFTGTDPVHSGNFNANRAIVTSAVLYCLRCLIDDDIPLNAGVLAPVRIVLPECFLNPTGRADPQECPAVAAGNVETSQRIVDCVFGALGIVAASQGTMNNLLMGNERFGYYETICGGAGAGPGFHGADAVHTNMTNTRLTDPEVLESRYPVRLLRFEIRKGSGGQGRFHGGCGVIREFEFLEPLDVSIISQRRHAAPYGLNGGQPGLSGRNTLIRASTSAIGNRQSQSENEVILPPVSSISVHPGDRLIIETPGGGGWGPP